ncbi:MAG: RagB/SusD family nutrient uptake outer membrane protein [Saprospiraceae bacterium]|nr:RagB/SusD family nutrient uptake outer membrane protein [Saprospiraceae bacterium]
MKSLKYTLGLCLVLMGLMTSCKESIIDITPATKNAAEDFYKSESQFNQAVIAGYNSLLTMPSGNWNLSEVRSDNGLELLSNAQRDVNDVGYFIISSQTGVLQTVWSQRYVTVYRSNILLDKIEGFSFARVNQFKAEGRFLRALAYFDLVRYFGDVPMALKVLSFDEAKFTPRTPVATVYDAIVDDLKFAADNLPEIYTAAGDKGRATKWAAKALLGRVYLTMAGFPLKQADKLALAKTQLADVIAQQTKYFAASVPAAFRDMFKAVNDNKYHVFEVQYVSGGLRLGNYAAFDMAFQYPSQWSAFQPSGYDGSPSPLLVKGWSNTDKRKYATLDTGYTDTKTGAKSNRVQYTKFLEKGSTIPVDRYDHPNNYPLIRYEDVLLMYAEILNEEVSTPPAQAVTILNRIRTRAGMPNITPATKADFRLAMEQERQWEFCGEGLRWHDLVRTERALPVMNKYMIDNNVNKQRPITADELIYPIPQKEMLINPGFWKQNPGYN